MPNCLRAFAHSIRRIIAKALARLFHRIVDSQLEFEWSDPDHYEQVQKIRKQQLEKAISRYMGPV